MNKVIQIANLLPSGDSHNSLPGRIYYPKGICPCLRTPTGELCQPMFLWIRPKYPPKLRYALGRSNHCDGTEDVYGCKYGTSKFHVNNYFNTVTAIQMSNRRQWIAEIQSDPTSSDSPTTVKAISPTTTPSNCGFALSPDAPETD